MRQCSRRMKRLLTILLIEIVIAVNVLSAYAFEGNSYTYTDQEVQLMQAAVQGGNSDAGGTAGNLIEPEEGGGNGSVENNEGKDNVNEGGTGEGNADGNVENNEGEDNVNEGGTGEGGTDGNVENNEGKDNGDEGGTGEGGADGNVENNEGKDNEEEDDIVGTTYDIADWINGVKLYECESGLDGYYYGIINWKEYPIYPGYGIKAEVSFSVPDGITINYKDQLTFKLPDFLSGIVSVEDGVIFGSNSGERIGKYEIIPGENGGEMCLSFDESYFENGGSVSYGSVSFKGLMKELDDVTETTWKKLYFGNYKVEVWLAPLDNGIGYLNISKTHKNGSTPEIVTYTVTVEAREDSEVALREVVLKDAFTSGKEYVQNIKIDNFKVSKGTVTFQGDPYVTSENTLEWEIGTMPQGSKVTCTYTVTFGPGEQALVQPIGYLVNTATANAKNAKFPVNATDRYQMPVEIKLGEEVISQTFTDSRTGKTVTDKYNYEDHSAIYEITVTNKNSMFPASLDKLASIFNQQERDIVLEYNDFEINGGSMDAPETDAANGEITWKNVSIPAGGTATIRYKVSFADYRNGNRDGKKDIYTFENYSANTDIENYVSAYANGKCIASNHADFSVRRDYFKKTAQTQKDCIRFYIYVNAEKNYDLYDFTGWTIKETLNSQSFGRKDDLKIKPESVRIYYADSNRPLAQCKELDNTGAVYQDQSFSYQVPEGYGKKYIVISYDVIPTVELEPGERLSCYNPGRITAGDRFFEAYVGGDIKATPAFLSKKCTSYSIPKSEIYWKCSFSASEAFVKNGYHFVDYMWTTGYERTGDDHYLDPEDMDLQVLADGEVIPEGEDTWTFNPKEQDNEFEIYFHNAAPYKNVTITYKTKMKKQPKIYAHNEFYLYARGSNGLVGKAADSVSFNRTYESDVCKKYNGFDASTGTMEWLIGINENGHMSGSVELTEILPEGHTFVDASVVQVGEGYGEDADKVTVTLLSSEPGQVKLSVDGIKIDDWEKYGWSNYKKMVVWIKVTTKLTPEQMRQYVFGEKLIYTNRVILRDDTDNPPLEAKATGAIQTKAMTKEAVYKDGIASYTVDINPTGADTVPEEDWVTLTDEMAEQMVLYPETIKLIDESGASVNYDLKLISPCQFEITVPDGKHLTLTYEAYVKGKVGEVYTALSNTISYKGYTTTSGQTHTFKNLRVQRCAVYAGGYNVSLKKMNSSGEALSGAQFQIYYFDGDEMVPDKIVTTGANGKAVIPVNIGENDTKGKKYAYQEIKAPEGYVLDSDIYEFYVAALKETTGSSSQIENVCQIGSELFVLNEKKAPEPTPTLKPTEKPTATPTAIPEPTETPSATPEPSPTATILPTVAPSTTPSSTATPGQEEVPQTPPGPAQNEQIQEVPEEEISPLGEAQVLGAVRIKENGVVLGARRGVDFAVLGKRRRPSTGDSSELLFWIILLGGAAVTAGTSIVMCKVSSKKK